MYVDGAEIALAKYGSLRSDVCAIYTTGVGCPYVGFSYALNTAILSNGPHTIMASAIIQDGQPVAGTGSVAVTVAN